MGSERKDNVLEMTNEEYRKKNLQQINEMLQILSDKEILRIMAYLRCLYFD